MVKLVTIATHSESYFPWLQESCKRYNTNLEILGWGEKWQGYSWKFTLMLNYLEKLNPEELVCFVDAYDVLLLRPLDDMQTYYENINKISDKKIIVGIDLFDSKLFKEMNDIFFSTCENSNINSGVYIGKCKDLLKIITHLKNINNNDDQVMLVDYCINHSDVFYIDTNSELILNFNNTDEIRNNSNIEIEEDNNFSLRYKNARPFFVHGPGNTEMFELLKKLHYDITPTQVEQIKSKAKKIYFNKSIYYAKEMFHRYYLIIFILLLIVLIIIYYRKK